MSSPVTLKKPQLCTYWPLLDPVQRFYLETIQASTRHQHAGRRIASRASPHCHIYGLERSYGWLPGTLKTVLSARRTMLRGAVFTTHPPKDGRRQTRHPQLKAQHARAAAWHAKRSQRRRGQRSCWPET